jgi:ribonuclease HI
VSYKPNESRIQSLYAVKRGFHTGIFCTWDECKKEIENFEDAIYKRVLTYDEAYAFLNSNTVFSYNNNNDVDSVKSNARTNDDMAIEEYVKNSLKNGRLLAFVDGSYDIVRKWYGSGALIIAPTFEIIEITYSANYEQFLKSRNIAGEVFAALIALKWAKDNRFDKISILYDYLGVCNWIDEKWRTEVPVSIKYVKTYQEKYNDLDLNFYKIKAHSNNKYNDIADQLAKMSLSGNFGKPLFELPGYSNKQINYKIHELPEFNPEN